MTEPIDQATKDLIEKEANDLLLKYPADSALTEGRKKWYIAGATAWAEKLKQERNKAIQDAINCVAHGVSKGVPADKIVELLVSRFKDKSHE